jgi:hypothetical protein
MDRERRLLEFYHKALGERVCGSFKGGPPLMHAAWMAEEMLRHLGGKQPDRAKASRWIGFIQGILWMTRTFTIDELRQHTKDAGKPQRPPNHDTPTA